MRSALSKKGNFSLERPSPRLTVQFFRALNSAVRVPTSHVGSHRFDPCSAQSPKNLPLLLGCYCLNPDPSIALVVRSDPKTVLHFPLVVASSNPLTPERRRFENLFDLGKRHLGLGL